MEDIEEELERINEKFEKAKEKSRELDTLKGKLLTVPVADGKATYEVKKVKDGLALVILREDLMFDNYTLPLVGKACWLDKRNVERQVERGENMDKIFGSDSP